MVLSLRKFLVNLTVYYNKKKIIESLCEGSDANEVVDLVVFLVYTQQAKKVLVWFLMIYLFLVKKLNTFLKLNW